jgi:apolipoprotein N-acyltransferase
MPAVSDAAGANKPALPRTWRPLGVRVAGVFFFAMLLVVCLFAWVGFSQEVRDQFTFMQKATLVALGAAIGGVLFGLFRSRITATEQGLVVVNCFRTHTLAWDEVDSIHMRSGAPWATLRLADDTVRQVIALQGSDGARAVDGVRTIRGLLADR